ncbi:acyl carrier protein [Eubacterium xylanophilum]|uniref:acyl carrier protein n=1 Tax=Eubacterium xylanophilum TaxID=39497 RepID=UPI0004B199CA|nr:phosphopantetheine-binding protein [Eubacterium xylanophilum]
MNEDIIDKIIEIYSEKRECLCDPSDLLNKDIYDDLGFDSVDAVNLMTYLEDKYKISYEDAGYGITNHSTLKDFINFCENIYDGSVIEEGRR